MSRWPPGTLRWALVPVALGLVAGGLLELTLPGSRMYLTAAPGLVALVAGLLAGAGAAVAALTRRRTAASEPAPGVAIPRHPRDAPGPAAASQAAPAGRLSRARRPGGRAV
jgi:hypothetical protein